MVKLKRLKINQYRNVRPGTELRFDDGVNLVLGKNGTGKTTLLALLSCVAGSDFSSLQGEPFDLEYEITGGDFTARISIQVRARSEALGDPRYADRGALHVPAQPTFEYHAYISNVHSSDICEIRGTQLGTHLRVTNDSREQHLPPASPFQRGEFLASALLVFGGTSPFAHAWNCLYVALVARFDESLDSFLAMTGRASVTACAGTPAVARLAVTHHPPQPGPPWSPSHSWTREFAPADIGPLIPSAHESPAGEIRILTDGASDPPPVLAFLAQAATAMNFSAAALKPEIKIISKLVLAA